MPRTAFTSNEWSEFCGGFDNPEDALEVANHIWGRERIDDLKRVAQFCEDTTAKDLLEAAHALATTNSNVFHEIEERLLSHLWEHSEDYRDDIAFRQEEAAERRYFGNY